jgi:hypothetical protein
MDHSGDKGVKSKKLDLNNVNKYENLPNAVLNYINRYQKKYKNVIKEKKMIG